jgi:hypothetical protein
MAVKQRITQRKSLIERVFAEEYFGRPVLLEELRWKVLIQQYGATFVEITDANQRSFTRTMREQFPKYRIHKISIGSDTSVGLAARAAVYRVRNREQLDIFLHGMEPCILCRYRTNMSVDEPRYRSGNSYVTAHYHSASFRFFTERPTSLSYDEVTSIPGTFIPATHKLSLVVMPGTDVDMRAVAAVPWKLFGYEKLNDWHEVEATDSLEAVERNRWL